VGNREEHPREDHVNYAPKPFDDMVVGSVFAVELSAGDAIVMPVEEPSLSGVTMLLLANYAGWEPREPIWFPRGCVMLEAKRKRIS
jgi:hypothetical protein